MLDKHLLPNLVALAIVLASLAFDGAVRTVLLSTGLFALSGALTNWLAVHMLFQRVPGLYGSGVIELNFEAFKSSIRRMVREELLDPERVAALLARQKTAPAADATTDTAAPGAAVAEPVIDLVPMIENIDLDAAYDQLVATITESAFGNMLQMVGGEAALQPLREPFKKRMKKFIVDAAGSPRVQAAVAAQITSAGASERFASKLDTLLAARLDELTPGAVRDIMQRMIRRHLGWLVVWGGVFGGLIGLVAGLVGLSLA